MGACRGHPGAAWGLSMKEHMWKPTTRENSGLPGRVLECEQGEMNGNANTAPPQHRRDGEGSRAEGQCTLQTASLQA